MNICARQPPKHRADIITPPVLFRSLRSRKVREALTFLTALFYTSFSVLHSLMLFPMASFTVSKQTVSESIIGEVTSLHLLNQSLLWKGQMTVGCQCWFNDLQHPPWCSENAKKEWGQLQHLKIPNYTSHLHFHNFMNLEPIRIYIAIRYQKSV